MKTFVEAAVCCHPSEVRSKVDSVAVVDFTSRAVTSTT